MSVFLLLLAVSLFVQSAHAAGLDLMVWVTWLRWY